MNALLPFVQQLGLPMGNDRLQVCQSNAVLQSKGFGFLGHVQDVGAFEITGVGYPMVSAEDVRILGAKNFPDLVGGPDKEPALHSLAVGILSRIETAVFAGHFPPYIVKCLFGNAAVAGVPGNLKGMQVKAGKQSVVIEHLFKVRDKPESIGGITMEPTANLVIHPAESHLVQS